MFKFLGRLFGTSKPVAPKTYTIEINGVTITLPDGKNFKYRRNGNACLTFRSRPVQGNAKKAA